jgi:murein DD-endopeptidase MepM/ murein hydrolase activator NlpD
MTRHNKRNTNGTKQNKRKTSAAANQRIPTVIISCAYLFAPLLFITPTFGLTPKPSFSPTAETPGLLDVLDGRGGPELVPIRTRTPLENLEVFLEESSAQYAINASSVLGPNSRADLSGIKTTITKTYNYLKVADTAMPTTSPETTSEYGWRVPPCKGCSSDHKGIDFVPGEGSPIFAVADGMVIDMGSNGGYGNFVRLKHLMANSEGIIEEWVTLYAHMKNDSFPKGMKVGSTVKSGDTIGAVGNTGMSTGPHLHFELIINGEHVDPLPLLGTYEVIIVTEEDYPDYMFVGETIRSITKVITYE